MIVTLRREFRKAFEPLSSNFTYIRPGISRGSASKDSKMFRQQTKTIKEIERQTESHNFQGFLGTNRRPTDNIGYSNFTSKPAGSRELAEKNSDIFNFPDAPISISAVRDSDGVLDNVQQGEFLFSLNTRDCAGPKKFHKVLPFQVINNTLNDSFQQDSIAHSGMLASDISTQKKTKKRARKNDLMAEITNGRCHTIEEFIRMATPLGFTVTPGNNHVVSANKLGSELGLKALVFQARGRAIVPNLWGEIQLGDRVGFIIKKFHSNSFTSGEGMSSARSKTSPLMIFPCVNHLGHNTINNKRYGRSTLVGVNNRSVSKKESDRTASGKYETLAERCTTGSDMNPKTIGKTFVDFEVVETTDYEGRRYFIGTPVVKMGYFIHLGKVYKRGSPVPTLSSIHAAVVPGCAGTMGMQAAYRDLQIKNSMEIMVEPHRIHSYTKM